MAEQFYLDASTEALVCDKETRKDYEECIRPYSQRTDQEDRLGI